MADQSVMLTGSLCLSDIPREQLKKVMCKDGKERIYVNVAVFPRKDPQTFTNSAGIKHTYTHNVSCAPPKNERVEGVNYYIGDLEERPIGGGTPARVTAEDINNAPSVSADDDMPF